MEHIAKTTQTVRILISTYSDLFLQSPSDEVAELILVYWKDEQYVLFTLNKVTVVGLNYFRRK